jgi:formylglycine-generating enzyme required for sulfatase activity
MESQQAPGSQPGRGAASTLGELTLDLGNNSTLKLVRIPPGTFTMGSPETEKNRGLGETQHQVPIDRPFYMGVTHVTVHQFATFVNDTGYKTDAEKLGWGGGHMLIDSDRDAYMVKGASWHNVTSDQIELVKSDHPAVQISWNDAKAFCKWLSNKFGRMVDLPTEAQWEYACRGGSTSAYPWGESPEDGKGWANCADQSLKEHLSKPSPIPSFLRQRVRTSFFSWNDGFVLTSPVGIFKANAFGLRDMIGNASQWCQDLKSADIDPVGPSTANWHIIRGGSWNDGPANCRSAARTAWPPDGRDSTSGFRVTVQQAND